jgi:hypothetical protein
LESDGRFNGACACAQTSWCKSARRKRVNALIKHCQHALLALEWET